MKERGFSPGVEATDQKEENVSLSLSLSVIFSMPHTHTPWQSSALTNKKMKKDYSRCVRAFLTSNRNVCVCARSCAPVCIEATSCVMVYKTASMVRTDQSRRSLTSSPLKTSFSL